MLSRPYKNNETDMIWWRQDSERFDSAEFSFDKVTWLNPYLDYPKNLTPEQIEIFNKENPFWAKHFGD